MNKYAYYRPVAHASRINWVRLVVCAVAFLAAVIVPNVILARHDDAVIRDCEKHNIVRRMSDYYGARDRVVDDVYAETKRGGR